MVCINSILEILMLGNGVMGRVMELEFRVAPMGAVTLVNLNAV